MWPRSRKIREPATRSRITGASIAAIAFDRRGNLNISAAYELPRFENHAARIMASDWRISPIFRYLTGQPITITTGVDRALNDNTTTQRPNQVLPDPYATVFSIT